MNAAIYPVSRVYYDKVLPSVKSLMVNSDVDTIYLTIEDDEYPGYLPECVKTINANVFKQYFYTKGPNIGRTPYVWLCMARVIYAGYMYTEEHCDRILSLDADTIVADDIGSEPWTMDMNECHFAGVPELKISAERRKPYANAGVMIMNLERIHHDGKDVVMLHKLNTIQYQWLEQDCINENCILQPINSEWNSCQFTHIGDSVKIRHYAYEANWLQDALVQKYRNMSWEEAEEKWRKRKGMIE